MAGLEPGKLFNSRHSASSLGQYRLKGCGRFPGGAHALWAQGKKPRTGRSRPMERGNAGVGLTFLVWKVFWSWINYNGPYGHYQCLVLCFIVSSQLTMFLFPIYLWKVLGRFLRSTGTGRSDTKVAVLWEMGCSGDKCAWEESNLVRDGLSDSPFGQLELQVTLRTWFAIWIYLASRCQRDDVCVWRYVFSRDPQYLFLSHCSVTLPAPQNLLQDGSLGFEAIKKREREKGRGKKVVFPCI